jgi:hypothetical protein
MTDENEVFSFLMMIVQETPAQPYFLSILQHLLLIRDDEVVRFDSCRLDTRGMVIKLSSGCMECWQSMCIQKGGLEIVIGVG